MSEMVERVAKAMQQRAKERLANLESLERVEVGSLGDAWAYLARAAISAMLEPTEGILKIAEHADNGDDHNLGRIAGFEFWRAAIIEALH
jgi:hypothetical protein